MSNKERTTPTTEASTATAQTPASPTTAPPAAREPAFSPTKVIVLPPDHWAEIQGNNEDGVEAALGDDAASTTVSISSSILEYRTFYGRTYHSDRGNAKYWGANDDQQSESMDIFQHAFTLLLDDKLCEAPVENVKNVLDVGTGTGIWAIDFADEHPEAKVIGTDVSPIQPSWVPPNTQFEMEDFNSPWTFRPQSFDYIHMRYLVGCVKDWYRIMREAYATLEPGGIIESQEVSADWTSDDNTVTPESAIGQWGPIFMLGGDKLGCTFRVLEENLQVKALKAAGFVDIVSRDMKVCVGTWPKDPRENYISTLVMYGVLNDVEGFILLLTSILGWSREQVTVYAAYLRRELTSGQHHSYFLSRVVYARKPKA